MAEATENGQTTSNQSIIRGSQWNMSELSETANEYGRKVADAASRASDYVGDKVTVVGDKLKELQGKEFSEIANDAKDYARKNPGQAILISAAAGVLLGFLLRGSRR
jgi:ElaB/YqjD/DUF883 family membrane-anchored ribosome-binding protein